MNKNILVGLSVMTLVIVVGSYLGKDSKPVITKNNVSSNQPSENATITPTKEVVITAKDFSLSPGQIAIKKGEIVKIILKNDGAFDHDLYIDDLNISIPKVAEGETGEVIFVADKEGEFKFECTVGGHKDLGMQGTITVE